MRALLLHRASEDAHRAAAERLGAELRTHAPIEDAVEVLGRLAQG